ncbi:hypothetical protein [Spartinivicinus ruber]|uniref:hypothetical protein n=1 Tax=Spartinivicinus ruber TaxID=2683272 RepID=UPI0013D31DB3|nr:hypothetical protein [Spartinivicinus ruber]
MKNTIGYVVAYGGLLATLSTHLQAADMAGFRLHDDLYICINKRCEQIDGDGGSGGAGEVFYSTKNISAAWNSSNGDALLCTRNYSCRIRSEASTGSKWTTNWFSLHGNSTWESGPLAGANDPDLTAAWNTTKYGHDSSIIAQGEIFWVWSQSNWHGPHRFDTHPGFKDVGITKVNAAYNDGYKSYWDVVYLHPKDFPRNDIVIWNNHKPGGAGWMSECIPACSLMGIGTDYMIGPTRIGFNQKVLFRRTDKANLTINADQVCYYNGVFKTMYYNIFFQFSYGDSIVTPYHYPSCGGTVPPTESIHSMFFDDGTFSTYWDWQ